MSRIKSKISLTVTLIIFIVVIIFFDIIKGHSFDLISRFTKDELLADNLAEISIKTTQIDTMASGQDFLHNASGSVHIVKINNQFYIQLDKDFSSTPGPDYHIYFSSTKANIDNEEDFLASNPIELGKLKKGSGASYYLLDDKFNANDIKSITIYCKMFKEYIGSAEFN